MTMLIEDPKARERSLMHKQKTLCDGQGPGMQCKHYWRLVSKVDVANPDEVRKGRTDRFCILLNTPLPMMERGAEMAVECNQYEPGAHPYNPEDDKPNPMSAEEVYRLRGETPPVVPSHFPASAGLRLVSDAVHAGTSTSDAVHTDTDTDTEQE